MKVIKVGNSVAEGKLPGKVCRVFPEVTGTVKASDNGIFGEGVTTMAAIASVDGGDDQGTAKRVDEMK